MASHLCRVWVTLSVEVMCLCCKTPMTRTRCHIYYFADTAFRVTHTGASLDMMRRSESSLTPIWVKLCFIVKIWFSLDLPLPTFNASMTFTRLSTCLTMTPPVRLFHHHRQTMSRLSSERSLFVVVLPSTHFSSYTCYHFSLQPLTTPLNVLLLS